MEHGHWSGNPFVLLQDGMNAFRILARQATEDVPQLFQPQNMFLDPLPKNHGLLKGAKKNAMWWLGDRRKRGRHLNMLMASFRLVPVHWYTVDGWVQCVRGKHPCFKHVDRDVRLLPPSSDFVLGMLFLYVSLLFWGYCQSAPVQRQKLIAPMITHDYIFKYQPFFPFFLRKEHSGLLD